MPRLMILTCVVLASALHAERLDVPNGDFTKPENQKHLSECQPDGLTRVNGDESASLRWNAPAPWNGALLLMPGTVQRATLKLPALPQTELKAEGWYGVVSLDVLGLDGPGKSKVALRVLDAEAKKTLAEESLRIEQQAPKGGGTEASYGRCLRIWVRIECETFLSLAGKSACAEVEVDGRRAIVVDNLRLERFHENPTRKLLGKPNGVLGPDLLGAGSMGFDGLTEHLNTAFSILGVTAKGPAAQAGLTAGDLVVAIDGLPLWESSIDPGIEWFERSHEALCGRAVLDACERRKDKGKVTLTVLRADGLHELDVKVRLTAPVGEKFPFDDGATEDLYRDLLDWTSEHQKQDGTWPGQVEVNTSIATLALMATRDLAYKSSIDKAVDALLRRNPDPTKIGGFTYWPLAFQGILFCEYYLATGKQEIVDWIRAACEWLPTTTHECKWGMQAFGHGPDGLPYEDKALMAPAAHLLVLDALARKCKVDSRIWEAIEKYVLHSWSDPKDGGHGGMGYNASYKDEEEFWSRSGLTALSLYLRGDRKDMQTALVNFMEERHQWMLNSHAYGEPGGALGLVSLAVVDAVRFKKVLPQWRWRFMNAWEPGYGLHYSTPHMGSPYMGEDEILNPAYALVLGLREPGLAMLGAEPKKWMVSAGKSDDGAWCSGMVPGEAGAFVVGPERLGLVEGCAQDRGVAHDVVPEADAAVDHLIAGEFAGLEIAAARARVEGQVEAVAVGEALLGREDAGGAAATAAGADDARELAAEFVVQVVHPVLQRAADAAMVFGRAEDERVGPLRQLDDPFHGRQLEQRAVARVVDRQHDFAQVQQLRLRT